MNPHIWIETTSSFEAFIHRFYIPRPPRRSAAQQPWPPEDPAAGVRPRGAAPSRSAARRSRPSPGRVLAEWQPVRGGNVDMDGKGITMDPA